MKSLSDFQSCGFDEAEIFAFLAKHGVNIGEASASQTPVGETFPDWKRIMALHPKLIDNEAAAAFAGIDLVAPGWLSDDEHAELSRWQSVIRRAIRAGELVAEASDFERDGTPKEWSILPADLAAWCSAKGWAYPLPAGVGLPATDAGLRDALARCEQERAQWKAKAEAQAEVGGQRAGLQAEIDRLRGELRAQADDIAALGRERDVLKADALSGKARTTALKIIGGLAMQGYGMTIHAERLEGIAELVKDLEKAGAAVTEKTLREWIKEAANVIDPPQAKR
ncbi:hypothetical protein MASR1M60_29470 [Rhodocyclaceae bacterium]